MELDLETVVQWFGETPLATLTEEYNRAHVFCLPVFQEGFGSVFLEAMAAGKPIVAALNDSRPAGVVWVTEIPRSAIMI
jgi:glycosyltransferase involved in cell wall biosynthesis